MKEKQLRKLIVSKPEFVREMFNSLARQYDFLNNIISFGSHKFIKKQAIKKLNIKEKAVILDLCTGTGDISFTLSQIYPNATIKAVDYSAKMLNIAKEKNKDFSNIDFIEADALNLPFEDSYFDVVFISFGLRNLASINQGLLEINRVLKSNGFLSILDVGKPNRFLRPIFKIYFNVLMPFIARLFCKNNEYSPYEYLAFSSENYPEQAKIIKVLEENRFKEVLNYNYLFGAIAQQVAKAVKNESY